MRSPSLLASPAPRILLMTATIQPDPNASVGLSLVDPDQRRRQYEEAVRFYAGQGAGHLDGIVLAENSGSDLSSFAPLVPESLALELLTVPGEPTTAETDRGYLEMMLVARAFETSELLQQPGATAVKVTGRYRIENLVPLMGSMRSGSDLGFNLRRYPRRWADMWIFFANQRGMAALRPRLGDIDLVPAGGPPAEDTMFQIVSDLHSRGTSVQRRFAVEPRLSGVRGYDGARYESPRQRLKWMARTVVKRVAPPLWI